MGAENIKNINLPLTGVKVVEIDGNSSGAVCGQIFAEYGAEVIKVIKLGKMQYTWDLVFNNYFDRDKIIMDMGAFASRNDQRLMNIILSSDVLIYDGSCWDWGTISKKTNTLLSIDISPFGSTGPHALWQSSELILQAAGGILGLNGKAGQKPVRLGGTQAWILGGLQGAIAAIAGVINVFRTKKGCDIKISVIEAVASVLGGPITETFLSGKQPKRDDKIFDQKGPGFIVKTKDGNAVFHLASSYDRELFLSFAGVQRIGDDIDLGCDSEEMYTVINSWASNFTKNELFEQGQLWRFPFAMVLSLDELLNDPQIKHRNIINSITLGEYLFEVPSIAQPMNLIENNISKTKDLRYHNSSIKDYEVDIERFAPLQGTRVLDLTSIWAGPLCTRILADLGAEVIKIEGPKRPDGLRYGFSGFFEELNRGKYSVLLYLDKNEGKDLFLDLVSDSDLLVDNFSPRVMSNFGLPFDRLKDVNPHLMQISISAYGANGPYQNYVGYGYGLSAMGGIVSLIGYEGEDPIIPGIAYADPIAGIQAALSCLAALYVKIVHSVPFTTHVDFSVRDSIVRLLGTDFIMHQMDYGYGKYPLGNNPERYLLSECFKCKGTDSWIAVTIRTEKQKYDLKSLIGECSNESLNEALNNWTQMFDKVTASSMLQERGIAAFPVNHINDLLVSQDLTSGFLIESIDKKGRLFKMPGTCWKVEGSHVEPTEKKAPAYGEHTELVLRSRLMLSEKRIKDLYKDRIITS